MKVIRSRVLPQLPLVQQGQIATASNNRSKSLDPCYFNDFTVAVVVGLGSCLFHYCNVNMF
jgi:hypothetical protein